MHSTTESLMKQLIFPLTNLPVEGIPVLNYHPTYDHTMHFAGGELYFKYKIEGHQTIVARTNVESFPKCNGIAIITKVMVMEDYRGRGIGTFVNQFTAYFCRKIGYSVAMCSVRENNMPMRCILAKNGWNENFEFMNKKTGNDVVVYSLNLSAYEEFPAEPNLRESIVSIY